MSAFRRVLLALAVACIASSLRAGEWTIYIANDNCPDYTWGFNEEQTRQAFADIIKGHLDEMKRTDGEKPENQNRYNAAVTNEVLCFLERYPDRKDELVRRIKEGRLYVSPYLCNSLWGLQSFEGTIRTFFPARRLERELGVPMEYAHHIELPSLPWGHATILAGCGIKGLTVPFYNYDSQFAGLKTPPLFWHEGPDGSRVMVCLDAWASNKASYMQGLSLLKNPNAIGKEWLPHYAGLGEHYPLRGILAAGTHGDINPGSGGQARGFAEKIIAYNAKPDRAAKLVNATYPQFWQAVAASEKEKPWLPTVRGCFGHTWEAWPVSLAKYAAEMRAAEREALCAEALLAIATSRPHGGTGFPREAHRRGEWCWAMLSDHAWNGTDVNNQKVNADLRRQWLATWRAELSRQFAFARREIENRGREAQEPSTADLGESPAYFNDLGFERTQIVYAPVVAAGRRSIIRDGQRVASQFLDFGGKSLFQCYAAVDVPSFGFAKYDVYYPEQVPNDPILVKADERRLVGRFYHVSVDQKLGGIRSLVHQPTGKDLIADATKPILEPTLTLGGDTYSMTDVKTAFVAQGPILAMLKITGKLGPADVTTLLTIYEPVNQIDIEYRVRFPVTTKENRLCQAFPFMMAGAQLRVATPGAVVRPKLQPQGDLLPGADPRRITVQEFVSIARDDLTITLVPLDASLLRLDGKALAFEALGNDQNYKEVAKDQNGEKEFTFRYVLRAEPGGYSQPRAYEFATAAARPLVAVPLRARPEDLLRVAIDPARAIATCLKPADDAKAGGSILRVQETAGKAGPVTVNVWNVKRAIATDLLERDLNELPIKNGRIELPVRPLGFAAVRLLP